MEPLELIKGLGEVAVLLVSCWGAYNAQKSRGDLLALKIALMEWTDAHFMRKSEMTVYEHRLDRLEERPSNRIVAREQQVN